LAEQYAAFSLPFLRVLVYINHLRLKNFPFLSKVCAELAGFLLKKGMTLRKKSDSGLCFAGSPPYLSAAPLCRAAFIP